MPTIPALANQKIAITATFTSEPVEDSLSYWLKAMGFPDSIEFAQYNQVFQELLNPSSLLATNHNGVNVILVRFEDWQETENRLQPIPKTAVKAEFFQNENSRSRELGENITQIEQTVQDFANALKTATTRSPNPHLVCICPPSPTDEKAFNELHEKLQEQLEIELQKNPSICLIKSQELLRTYPVQEYYDPYGDELGHIPYNLTFFTALGTILARKILALKSSPYKVIALDCDNTLWNGICGEDGVKGVKIDAPFRALQEFIIAQQATGKLICLCSKNQADDVFAVFEQHPDMLLKRNHLVNWRINWQEKSQNLQSLAEELQLGLDSFIFIDDNPIECAEVRANCPEVLTLQLPQESEKIPQFLAHIWAFDQLQTTQEDQQRTNLYQQNIQRQRLQEDSLSFEDFLAQLNLEIEISPIQTEELTRVAQLTQRTNQFNLTTIRRSESQIKQLCSSGELDCRGVKVKDRFGDYGLVGLLLFTVQKNSLIVDTFLLSCRVLGRGVEHQILAYLGTIAQEKRLAKVELFYKPTPKNKPIWDFLTGIEKGLLQEKKDGVLFEFPAQIASETIFSPRSNLDSLEQKTKISLGETTAKSDSLSYRVLNYQFFENIAQNLYNPELILQEIAGQQQRQRQLDGEFVAPRTPLEKAIASLFIEVLKLDRVGIDDDFFVLGGDSLQATQLISRIRTSLKVELPLPSIFTATTVTTLAQEIEQWGQKNLELTALTILPRTGDAQIPLSYAQQRLWFLDQFQPNSALYNIPLALRLEGNLNQVALEQALQTIIERHEALRTNFLTIEGKPTQIIQTETNWTISIVHPLQPPRKSEREITCQQLINTQAIQPFDLATEPLIRVTLLTLSQTEQVLLVCMHHVVSDGWSMGVFVQELAVLYDAYTQGKLSPLAPLPIQYADFALWQRQWLQEDVLETQLAYWQKQLAGATTFLPLPTDKPRPAVQTFVGAHQEFILSPELSQKLTKLSQEQGVTLFMTLFAAFDVLLYRYTGQTDILVGTPIANRNHSEIEGLIGFFVNTLVLRTNLAENSSFEQLLAQVREVALEAYSHQDLPFEMLVEALQPERDISYTPLFQVMFVLQNTPLSTVELTGLSISSVQVETNTAKFDLSLAMENTDAGLVGVWEYNTDLFSPDTIERMTGHFLTLLEGIVTNQKETLAELPLLTQLEQKQLLIEWNNTQVDYPVDKCIHQLFEEQVERTPDAVAVVFENESLTYGELNNRANQLAHYLRQNYQIKPDTLVGICVERSLEMIIGILGILKAGAAYLPLDPEYPSERLQFILEDSGILLLLTQGFLEEKLRLTNLKSLNQILYLDEQIFSSSLTDNPSSQTKTDSLAYVIYTSGSTGKPKGVMIENRSIVNLALAWSDVFQIQNHSRVLQFGSLSFDLSIGEIASALAAGASLYLAQKETLLPSQILVDLLTENQISHAFLSPSALSVLPQATLSNLQSLTVGGEACTAKLITEWSKGRNFFNAYGPTETTVCATVARFTKDEEKVSIGRPIFNTQIYILDSNLQPVPVGIPGELHIGGAGLARGYLNRPELTQEKFIPNPFSNYPDSRLYKTGDLARYLPDGNIEYLGRIDNQVKIRGFRIELGEIETVLTQNPQVQSSVIIACEDTPGNKRLVAYIVPQKDATPTPNELRQFLKEKLPEYMIPSAFVILESLPLTPNGKIDRRALPEPEQSYERTDKFILPRNPIEEILVTIWSEVLKVKQVSINDNFFELGGHSLLATQLISRIRTNLQIEIPLRSLFAAPTIEELGQQIQQLQQQDLTLSAPPILPRGEQSELLLSYAQTRLWFLDQLETNSAFYNIPVALRLQGHLNQAALIQSLEEIIQRHEALRTNFVNVNGQPTQVIQTVTNWTVSVINLQHLSPEEQEIAATNLVKGESFKPFDLANEALVRATLIVLNNNEYWLLLCLHHVISDGWSMGVFIEELTALYNAYNQGQPSPLKPLPIQYADFAVWQRQWLQGEVLENQLNYWQKQLADAPTFLPLPTDKPRPVIQTFTGAYQEFQLSLELTQKLTQLSQQQGVTMFMTLLAVYGTLLYRYTGQSDILIGTPIANRNRREIESLIGFFVNTLVMRTDCSENPSFQELLMRVREMSLGAYAHQDLPFEMLVEALQPERNLSHTPLFQVMFVLQNTPLSEVEMSGLTVNSLPLEGETAKFDLTLSMQNTETGLMGVWEYNTDLFNSETIERMNGHFMTLLEGIIANPRERVSQLPLLTKVEQQQLLIDWNNTEVDYPDDKCIHQLFEEQVERTPNAVAVVFEGQQLTYNELNCRTNQLAHYLQSLGVKADELVGICVERSLEMIVGLLGILKAGGAYVPLDPEYPLERLSFMLEDAAVNVLLTQQKLINKLPEHQAQLICLDADWELIFQFSRDNLITDIQATNLAYVIYTSGSTGQPKGVMLSHSNLSNHMFWMQETFPLTRADRVLQKTSFSFDASVWEFYAPLLVGGQLLIAQPGGHTDSDYLLKTIAQQQVTTVQLVPSLLQMLLEQGGIENCQLLKRVFCGGEILPVALQEKLFSQLNVNLCNLYGPTECCIDVTFWNCQREMYGQRIPIGRPIFNTQIYILDSNLQPVPVGIPGELHIGGAGLARGYLNRPELTQEKFIPNPFSNYPDSRLYKTGDLARYLPDGNIEYLGRIDNQVKIRGFRIELGEIETVLTQNPQVQSSVIIACEDTPGNKRLVAYIVPQKDATPTPNELRQFLKEKLPEYMIPSAFVILESLPLTPNGKIDRRALPEPEQSYERTDKFILPRNPIEEILVTIWSEVLKVKQVSINDNFFELGGHSLLATQLISRIRTNLQIEIPLRSLFAAPTIEELGQQIQQLQQQDLTLSAPPILPRGEQSELLLSYAQTRLWFLDQLETNSAFYNIPVALRLQGHLNQAALIQSLEEIIQRHEALRTNFVNVNGQPTQVIQTVTNWTVSVINLQHLSPEEQEIAATNLVKGESFKPFDLANEALVRATLIVLNNNEYWLLLCLHHVISDGWSMGVFIEELTALYNAYNQGQPSPLKPLPIQYADFAVWQRQWLQGEVLENQLNYWQKQLADAPTFLPLPTDKPRPVIQTFTGAYQEFQLSLELTQKLTQLSQQQGVTMFMTLLAVYGTLLYRYTGQSDILIGTPIANRNRREIESLIGFFVNTLVMRTDCSENPSFQELLMRVREMSLGAYAHQDLPFEMLVEALQPERNLSHTPLFQVMFVLQNTPLSEVEMSGLTVNSLPLEGETAKFDLTLSMQNTETGLMGVWEYNTDLFNSETIERMNGHFMTLLEGIIANPRERVSQLPLLTKVEQQQLLIDWNNTEVDYPDDKCIHQLFEEQVERTPNAVAVVFEGQQLTYNELNCRTNQLAHYLQSLGVKADELVGICVERSLEMIVGLLGILKAGGAYVPLDPEYPLERLSFMLEDSQVKVLVTQVKLVESLPQHQAQLICLDTEWEKIASYIPLNPESGAKPDNLTYIIYTSGSTGKPKGVLVNHSNVVRLFAATDSWYHFNPQDVWTLFHSYAFDFSVWEMWGALLYGGRLIIVPYLVTRSPESFLKLLCQEKVTILNQTPTAFRQLIQAEASLKRDISPLLRGVGKDSATDNDLSLRLVIFGGESLEINSLQPWFDRHGDQFPQLVNMYGITETTVHVTYRPLSMADVNSTASVIGRPLPDLQVYLLDQYLQPVPVEVPGEMYVGGAGVTRGYLNRPELTTERFISSPFDPPLPPLNKGGTQGGAKLYKTGDLARYLPNGELEYLGRIDNQVKIRGFRIELGEIEALLASHPQIWETVVLVWDGTTGDKRLVAYIVPQSEITITIDEIRQFLKAKLPSYMIPNAFVILDALPLTANGKIDRRALPPSESSSEPSEKYVAPRNPIEDILVNVWSEILKVEKVGINDNFFELGGHSLLATQLVAQIRDRLKIELPLRQLFNTATLAELAQGIEQLKQQQSAPIVTAILPRRRK